MKLFFVDTDIFVRDLRYRRDELFETNTTFLKQIISGKLKAATSIFNVLEVCGIMSHNMSPENLFGLYGYFTEKYPVKIYYPARADGSFDYDPLKIFNQIQKKQSLGDAQIACLVVRFENLVSEFITWNVKDYAGKLPVPVRSPRDVS